MYTNTILALHPLIFYKIMSEQSGIYFVIAFSNLIDFKPNHSRDQEDFFEAKAASSPIMIYQVNRHKIFFLSRTFNEDNF